MLILIENLVCKSKLEYILKAKLDTRVNQIAIKQRFGIKGNGALIET